LLEQMELQLEELCRATIWMRRGGGNQSLKAAAGSEVMIDLSR
jgi:hypothetical protein